ncbi:hypothetical protein ACJZ2D_008600 [Fusarium nematophilum]
MVNLLYVAYALATVTGVQACERTCFALGPTLGNTCTYYCPNMCFPMRDYEARDGFLSALRSHGHSCSAEKGTALVHCKQTSKFGSCYDHYWSCGSGCKSHHKVADGK